MTTNVDDPLARYRQIIKSWNEPTGEVTYRALFGFYVDDRVREAAEAGRKFACLHLGVEAPEMLFYREAAPAEKAYAPADILFKGPSRNGHADRTTRTIGIRVEPEGCRPQLAAEVAAHEVFHLTQPKLKSDTEKDAQERDADAYGKWAGDVLVWHEGVVGRVHTHKSFPYDFITLRGVANSGDVLLVEDEGSRVVLRNFGDADTPRWVRHYAGCPVSVRS